MVIKVLDYVDKCVTYEEGFEIRTHLIDAFDDGEVATVSFEGVDNIPSSFANAAFVSLLDKFDFEFIKKHLSVVESTKQINAMIRDRLIFESNKRNGPSPTQVAHP